jgi:hypothetical protein
MKVKIASSFTTSLLFPSMVIKVWPMIVLVATNTENTLNQGSVKIYDIFQIK